VTLDFVLSWAPKTKEPDLAWLNNFRVDLFIENVTDEFYTPHLSGGPEAGINPGAAITWTRTW